MFAHYGNFASRQEAAAALSIARALGGSAAAFFAEPVCASAEHAPDGPADAAASGVRKRLLEGELQGLKYRVSGGALVNAEPVAGLKSKSGQEDSLG